MQPPIFYASPQAINDGLITLDSRESHHAVKVLRLKVGSLVLVVDGLGSAYRGEIIKLGAGKKVLVKAFTSLRNFGEPNVIITLAGGLSTGHKFDTLVEKGTELGVKRLVPLITEKSKVKIDDYKKAKAKQARYEKIALSAMKQCRRAYRPEISLPVTFSTYLEEIDDDALNLIFHPDKSGESLYNLKTDKNIKRINIIVGPESGFSDKEIELSIKKGLLPITLGDRILRTENAGPVICGILMYLSGELR